MLKLTSLLRSSLVTASVLGLAVGLTGCEEKGPAEKAGESIDKAAQNAKDAVTQPGPGEKAGREMDKALDK